MVFNRKVAGSTVDIVAFLSASKSIHKVFGGGLPVRRILQFLPRGVEPKLAPKRRRCNAVVFIPIQRLAVGIELVELPPVREIDIWVPGFEGVGPLGQMPLLA